MLRLRKRSQPVESAESLPEPRATLTEDGKIAQFNRWVVTDNVLSEVAQERWAQFNKWNEQNWADGTGPAVYVLNRTDVNLDLRTGTELSGIFRTACERDAGVGRVTWRSILLEEVFEALAEADPAKIRAELIQAVAVGVAWIEAIDRRG